MLNDLPRLFAWVGHISASDWLLPFELGWRMTALAQSGR
jgi:hypothetical protein